MRKGREEEQCHVIKSGVRTQQDVIDSEYEANGLAWESKSRYQEVAVEKMLMDDVEEMQRRPGKKFTKKRSLGDWLDARTFSFWKLF